MEAKENQARAIFQYSNDCFFFSSRRRHTRYIGDWSSDVCSSDLKGGRASMSISHQIKVGWCALAPSRAPFERRAHDPSPRWSFHRRMLTGALALAAVFLPVSEIGRASCRERG